MHPKFKKHFERKNLPSGKKNPKYIDVLDEDRPIRDQKYVCMSFVSPEKIIKDKELYMFGEFVKQWDFIKSVEKFADFIAFISSLYGIPVNELQDQFMIYFKDQQKNLAYTVEDDYKTFIEKNEEELVKKYEKENQFQTHTRGVKVRGVFPTYEDAQQRCTLLREKDPNFDIYVGEVGVWMPFDPDAYKTGNVQYMEEELNQLVHNKQKNEQLAKEAFDDRIKESKQHAIEENRKLAEKTGNRLTQTINTDGELEGIENIVDALGDERTIHTAESELRNQGITTTASAAAIESTLFDTTTVITDKTDHGQSLLVSGPFASTSASAL